MSVFPIGARVRAKSPDDFQADLARKLRNRVGVVSRHQYGSGNAIVTFAAMGRRKEFVWAARDIFLEAAERCEDAINDPVSAEGWEDNHD